LAGLAADEGKQRTGDLAAVDVAQERPRKRARAL
jgi:hypothetical protein